LEEEEYRGVVADKLREAGASVGDTVRLKRRDGFTVEGRILPRYSFTSNDILVLKLANGYNIGIRVDDETVVEKLEKAGESKHAGTPVPLLDRVEMKAAEKVYVIGTGGTIASRIDYSTGAVYPYISTEELLQAVPELYEIADVEVVELFNIFSEDMNPQRWKLLALKIEELFNKGAEGVVVAHGTDTMGYTAAAVAFAFRDTLPGPVVFTGSQRSSDRPSSDSAFNMVSAVLMAARSPYRESMVVMHGVTGDEYALAHRGVRVRKMHTSRRDAFQSINTLPLARIDPYKKEIRIITRPLFEKPYTGSPEPLPEFSDRIALIMHYPGMEGELIDMLLDRGYKGIVIAGTGFGHVSTQAIKSIERSRDLGVPVVVTSQCLFGRVNLNVYSTGRRMLRAGAIPAGDMLPETAYVKLSWLIGRGLGYEDVAELMPSSIVGETGDRSEIRYYPRWYHG